MSKCKHKWVHRYREVGGYGFDAHLPKEYKHCTECGDNVGYKTPIVILWVVALLVTIVIAKAVYYLL